MSDTEFREKLLSIQFAGKRPHTEREKVLSKDMDAYKRLRLQGLQPPQVDGSAALESRASTKLEVDMGHLFTKSDLKRAEEGMRLAEDVRFGI